MRRGVYEVTCNNPAAAREVGELRLQEPEAAHQVSQKQNDHDVLADSLDRVAQLQQLRHVVELTDLHDSHQFE